MSIYPHKDAKGQLTGNYKVEVQLKGQRLRGTFKTLSEAQANELAFKHTLVHPSHAILTTTRSHDKRDAPKTLGQLLDKAAPSIWRGKSTEVQSLQRCLTTVSIIGPNKALGDLGTSDIDKVVDSLLASAPATVNRYLSALHRLLDWGKERKYVPEVPLFTWQTEDEGRIRWITEDEEHRLYKALGE